MSIKDVEKFALWIIPEEIACRRLKEVIDRLSQEYSTPVFEPHLTLLGGLTEAEDILAKKASALGRDLKPSRYNSAFLTIAMSITAASF